MKTSKVQKFAVAAATALSLMLLFPMVKGQAMHIAEGSLAPGWCILWGALCLPFVVWGVFSIKKKVAESSKNLILLAMCGAFAFVLSALKIPSVTGSCSHPTGVGLGAILFGPAAMAVMGVIVLLFQAILLAHGGITTLGANTFSMAIAGPLCAFGIYKLCRKWKVSASISVFLAAFFGDLITYVVTSFQLSFAYPSPTFGEALVKFMGIFALTQIPLAVCEGLLTVVVYNVLAKYSKKELTALGAM